MTKILNFKEAMLVYQYLRNKVNVKSLPTLTISKFIDLILELPAVSASKTIALLLGKPEQELLEISNMEMMSGLAKSIKDNNTLEMFQAFDRITNASK